MGKQGGMRILERLLGRLSVSVWIGCTVRDSALQPPDAGEIGGGGGFMERKAVLAVVARKSGRGTVFCSQKFVFKDRCENTVNVARCYLVTFLMLVAWTTWEEVFIRNSYWTQSLTIPGSQEVPLSVMKYDPERIRIALLLRDCRLLTDCCVWWLKSYQDRCQVSGSECWRCQSILRSRHCVWLPWSHFTVRSGMYECVCVYICVCVCVCPTATKWKAKKQVKLPYILESNAHPNLIRTSFCGFL